MDNAILILKVVFRVIVFLPITLVVFIAMNLIHLSVYSRPVKVKLDFWILPSASTLPEFLISGLIWYIIIIQFL